MKVLVHLQRSFNTSHVVIYLVAKDLKTDKYEGFNTSHVVIYLGGYAIKVGSSLFQYISCCYLSQTQADIGQECSLFQYISCCYLSELYIYLLILWRTVSIHLMLLFILMIYLIFSNNISFQYISCCYLSRSPPC